MPDEIDDQLFKRLVLQNQYLILSHLDKDGAKHWRRSAEVIGQYWPLDELGAVSMLQSYERQPFTADMRTEMLDTLDLFEKLQDADDKGYRGSVDNLIGTDFPGYSGNDECEFLSFYSDVVDQGLQWPTLRRSNPNDLNSHAPMREVYGRLVAKWKEFGSPQVLSADQFQRILFEWVHPENRGPRARS